MLADHATPAALGDPEPLDEHDHCSPLALRGQKFPSASSLSIALSSSASASSFFSVLVLVLELAQAFGLGGLHAAVVRAPTVPARLGDLEMPQHLGQVLALIEQSVALAQLAHDLLGCVTVSLHRADVILPSMLGVGLPQQVDH